MKSCPITTLATAAIKVGASLVTSIAMSVWETTVAAARGTL